ncbi:CD1375 family protein [Paenibacillus sp. CFBP13512]|nr:CD1375 family protein [Paenibacillus sp. CFBP13512]
MAAIYVSLIQKGLKTIEDVPTYQGMRNQVQELLNSVKES